MKARNVIGVAVVSAGGWLIGAPAGVPATQPASRPATRSAPAPTESTANLVAAITAATEPRQAMAAYARGRSASRNDLALHAAYMRQMLKFGLPQFAKYPAEAILVVQPEDGMALGVTAYMLASTRRSDDLLPMLAATMKAVGKIPDDPGMQHNAGQLIAWYDRHPDITRVSDETLGLIQRFRGPLEERGAYKKARQTIDEAYAAQDKVRADYAARIKTAEAEADAIYDQGKAADREIERIQDWINRHRDRLRVLGQQRNLILSQLADGKPYSRAVEGIDQEMRNEEREIRALEDKKQEAIDKAKAILAKWQAKKHEVERLGQERDKAVARARPIFLWQPPAVDGVVTPPQKQPPKSPAAASGPQTGPQAEAAIRLRLAQQYLASGLTRKGREILQEIVKEYPNTKAAAEARSLIESLDNPGGQQKE